MAFRRQVADLRFNRALDAWNWLEEQGFEEALDFRTPDPDWRHPDGRWAEIRRDIDNLGKDDSPTGVLIFEPLKNS